MVCRLREHVPAPRSLRQGDQRTFERIGEAAEGKLARQRQPGLELAERRRIKDAPAAVVPAAWDPPRGHASLRVRLRVVSAARHHAAPRSLRMFPAYACGPPFKLALPAPRHTAPAALAFGAAPACFPTP